VKTVPLHGSKARGRVALVDDEDYGLVMQHRFTVSETIKAGRPPIGPYAVTNIRRPEGGWRTRSMHKMITGWPRTDHADHDGLNNQRSNLRRCSPGENMYNRLPNAGAASPYKGVTRNKGRGNPWRAMIRSEGQRVSLGLFASEIEAALAYDDAARIKHGEFARLNFPDQSFGIVA
jgi:hypothetical protein